MAVQVDTSPQANATWRVSGRKILRTSNGTLWVIAHQATDSIPRLRYSIDDGVNWSTSSTAFPETVDAFHAAWVFCSDGAIYIFYEKADGSESRVRKGTLNGGHTDISWSAATTVKIATDQRYFDLAVHEEGGDTIVHVVYASTATLCEYKRAVWGSAFGSTQVLATWSGATSPRIEFHHTQADVTAVKDSAPHIYVAWYADGKLWFRKNVYSSGPSWTWNAVREITTDAKTYFTFAMSFDGSDVVMIVESTGTADALLVLERDAADTITTSLANTPARTGTANAYTDITYNPDRDIEVFHTDSSAKVLQRVTYDRSGSAWGSWATIDADADDLWPNVKLGYWSGSKADTVEVIWMDQTGPNEPIMYERFEFDLIQDIVEAVGVTDDVTQVLNYGRAIIDAIGITDSVTTTITYARTVTDSIGLTDSASRAMSLVRAIIDAVGIIDSVTVIESGSTYTFTPTTTGHSIPIGKETQGGEPGMHSLWNHYGKAIPVQIHIIFTSGTSVLIQIPDQDTMDLADSGSGRGDKMIYPTPGGPYTITGDEAIAIIADGTYADDVG